MNKNAESQYEQFTWIHGKAEAVSNSFNTSMKMDLDGNACSVSGDSSMRDLLQKELWCKTCENSGTNF
jgi:hypothetical protein